MNTLPATKLGGFYAEQSFTPKDFDVLARAITLVNRIPGRIGNEWVRCHELARWLARHIPHLIVVDGKVECYEHTWLITLDRAVLDPYVPGHVPQVCLVDARRLLAPRYREGNRRTDIRDSVIGALDTFLESDAP